MLCMGQSMFGLFSDGGPVWGVAGFIEAGLGECRGGWNGRGGRMRREDVTPISDIMEV